MANNKQPNTHFSGQNERKPSEKTACINEQTNPYSLTTKKGSSRVICIETEGECFTLNTYRSKLLLLKRIFN